MKTFLVMFFLVILFCTTVVTAQTKKLDKPKAEIAELLKKMIMVFELEPGTNTYRFLGRTKGSLVLDDRIEFRHFNRVVYFSDIIDYQITTHFLGDRYDDDVYLGNLEIIIPGKGNSRKFYDDLILIQKQLINQLIEKRNSQLILFEPIAAQYRALKIKPIVSEEQREYIVQANLFNQKKDYNKAIEFYVKAIELDKTAFPAAYSNLALLSAQVHRFDAAIFYMKIYLLLEPEASDARSSQDKIYEWKAQLAN